MLLARTRQASPACTVRARRVECRGGVMAARIGRYEVVSTLGRGGIAVVYEVTPVAGRSVSRSSSSGTRGPTWSSASSARRSSSRRSAITRASSVSAIRARSAAGSTLSWTSSAAGLSRTGS